MNQHDILMTAIADVNNTKTVKKDRFNNILQAYITRIGI